MIGSNNAAGREGVDRSGTPAATETPIAAAAIASELDGADAHNTTEADAPFAGLRLLFAVDSRFPGLGGAENQALKLAIALRERGALVEFVTPRVLTSQSLEETFHGFTVKRVDYPHIRWVGSLCLMVWFARYLYLNRHRFDALHIHITHLLAASAGFARRWTGLPVTTKISGFYEFEGGVLDQRRRFMPLNFLIRLGLKQVDFVQTISDQTREKLLDAGFRNEQIKFVPNGIDTSNPPVQPLASDVLTIGYCGRLREVKGVHVLLDAFALLLENNPHQKLQLSIAGSGETSAALLKQADSLGIGENIHWLGLVEETGPFFQNLDIYVQPSFAEGLPNSVMEAMVEQRPVVASDIGGNNDLVEQDVTGLLFPPGDAGMLAEQIQRLIDEPVLRASVALHGRQLIVDRFGFDHVTESLAELYHV
ncbi:glycosyltransferase family 4 protein [Granulosicoccus antarcticus]|uniref:Alpha-D-kanosaminyltransferase n=1 Tax=Granulosicoccus antarcticus IMCC3135 TaxID=1192854 RepID=A0A2Z2P566_9GAMM|nr:glycosyltransferase family 4 protein [Granulosicoccus antarcticus]ASJ74974.1 Alpha-D-kanosaminyltransferase [Granulosicoccus antarcticus IMCC3135]